MEITIHQTILNIMNENRELLQTREAEGYVLKAAEGKCIRNKLTGAISASVVGGLSKEDIPNYEEIER